MALSPHNDDKNKADVEKKIAKLVKEDTAQSADKLKVEHNIGEKQRIVTPVKITTK